MVQYGKKCNTCYVKLEYCTEVRSAHCTQKRVNKGVHYDQNVMVTAVVNSPTCKNLNQHFCEIDIAVLRV